jgi:DMSO reductase anchor subunit
MAGAQFVALATKFFNLSGGETSELRASSKLLATTFRRHLIARGVLLALGAISLPLFTSDPRALWIAFALALASETIGRYLFFVSAVPKHLAAPYLGSEAA